MSLKGSDPQKVYQGFVLELRAHPCDVLGQDEHQPFDFSASLESTTEVVCSYPVLDYTDLGEDDEHLREYLEDEDGNLDEEDRYIMDAYDNARNKLEDRKGTRDFPKKKHYRLVFAGGVQLSADVLDAHSAHKGTKNLQLQPVPLSYPLKKEHEANKELWTWEDMVDVQLEMKESDTIDTIVSKQVVVMPTPMVSVYRLVIPLADLNKEYLEGGKRQKVPDVSGATAMMAALGKKKKKKKAAAPNS